MPRVSQAEGMLTAALNDLQRDWQIARSDWRDQARERFDEDFIRQFMAEGRTAVRAMGEMTLLLKRVVRACS